MRASKLLLALGLTAGVLSQPNGPDGPHDDVLQPQPTLPTDLSQRTEATAPGQLMLRRYADDSADHNTASDVLKDESFNTNLVHCLPNDPNCNGAEPRESFEHGQEICNPFDLNCRNQKRETTPTGLSMSDWTGWACSRGVQWACQYPEYLPTFKRSDIDNWLSEQYHECNEAKSACYFGVDCACGYPDDCETLKAGRDSDSHLGDIRECLCDNGWGWAEYCKVDSYGKRDVNQHLRRSEYLATIEVPTKTGQVSSATFAIAGQTITDILSLKNDSPTVMVEQIIQDGTAITFTASAKSNHPNVIVYTGVFDHATDSWTYTYSGDPWTSTILRATTLGKREQPPATTTANRKKPTTTQHSKPSVVDSDLVMKAKKVETVSILDEEPGHMTLNLEAATQKEYPTTEVTLIEHDGTALTLTPTTNSNGRTILVTEDPENSQETCTVSVFMDVDRVVSMHNHCMRTGRHMVTKTVTHQDHFDLTAPPTTEAHPFVASLAHPSVVTKVITQTVTKYSRYGHRTCCNRDGRDDEIDYMLATKTMVDLGSATVSLSKNMQLLNNSTLLMVPFQAQATMVPLAWDPKYLNGWEHIMDMDPASIRAMYPEADWEEIPRIAYQMRRRHGDIDPERSLKYAFVLMMWNFRSQYERDGYYYPNAVEEDHLVTTKTSVRLRNGDVVALTAPTQTIRGHVYSVDPKMKYMMWSPHNAVAPTQACVGDHDKHGKELHSNKTECRLQRCMWDFMKPINITTVQPMAMYDSRGLVNYNWFTHSTELHEAHWGTTQECGLYYPLAWKTADKTKSAHMARQTPDDLPKKIENRVHGDPECWDVDSCYDNCSEEAKDKRDPDILKWILPPILGVIALAALCCLLACCWHRRRRRDPERRHSSVIPEKLRRKSSHPQEVIVNTVTGTTTDTAGHPVDPHTAVETAAIAGTAAANENGRGTTGRRAEEGRGRVNFEDGGQPGTDAPGTEHTEAHPAESTEPKPVPDKDGATGTGRQGPDVGSMRGRKRNRPEGAGGLLGL